MKRLHYLVLLAIVLFTSCQKGMDYSPTPEDNFQALWKIIDQRYCFLDYKAQEIGLDWDEVYTRYHARLNPNMSNVQLFEVLAGMLSELRDGHVNLYTSLDVARNWSWREDYPSNYSEKLQDDYLGKDYHLAGGMRYRILDDNIGYISVPSFSAGIGDGALSDMLYIMRLCRGIIIDVRNNTGGDLTNAERLASRFTNERILVGYMCHKTGNGHSDFSTPRAEYLEPSKSIRWQRPVVVITNRSCYSATNTFVRNMRQCPLVTTLGDRTGGGSGLPMSSELPNGWSVRFSACPDLDVNYQHIEFGIEPDIPCSLLPDDEARGYDTLIEEARKLLKK